MEIIMSNSKRQVILVPKKPKNLHEFPKKREPEPTTNPRPIDL